MPDSILTLNDYGGLQLEQRTRASGKRHITMTIKSERIAVMLDEMEIARPVAKAIAQAISEGTKAIGASASKATIAMRKVAGKALSEGKAWALKRYAGGRTGTTAPGQSDRFGNDSGRLANGITANPNPSAGGFTINAPANRLNREAFGNDGAFDAWVVRWVELVPALRQPLDDIGVRRVYKQVVGGLMQKQAMQAAEKQGKLVLDAVKWFARLVA